MKILKLGWELPPNVVGGLSIACHDLATAISKKGEEVLFFVPRLKERINYNFKVVSAEEFAEKEGLPGMVFSENINSYSSDFFCSSGKGFLCNSFGGPFIQTLKQFAFLASKFAEKNDFDVVHAHDWLTFLAGILIKEKTGKPLVLHVHATSYDQGGGNVPAGGEQYEIEKMAFRKADKIIAVSKYTKNILIRYYGASPEKIRVVHNGVSRKYCTMVDSFYSGKKGKNVLFYGRLTIQKGPSQFVDAAKIVSSLCPDANFIIAGTGDMQEEIYTKVINEGLLEKTKFGGYIPHDRIRELYSMADVVVMPSISEPFGIIPLEAASFKTPVIVSKTSGVSEVLRNCFKVDFWDTKEMANKIVSVLKYAPLKEELAENAFDEVGRINWDASADKCISVYNEVLGGGGAKW